MKRTISLVVAFVMTATLVAAQSKPTRIEQMFMRLQSAEDEAEAKKDLAALDRLLNDDFIFIAANGTISDKKRFLADVKTSGEPASKEDLAYSDFTVRVYGKTAIVNYVLLVSSKDKDGTDHTDFFRISVVWIKQRKDWRISNFHVTRKRS